MKVGLCTIAYREWPLPRVLDLAAAIGFDGIELWGQPPHLPENPTPEEIARIREEIDQRGLAVAMFGSYLRSTAEDFAAEAEAVLQVTRGLGTRLVRVWAGQVGSERADESVWELSVRNLQTLCNQAAEHGIAVALERHENTLTDRLEGAERLLERVGRDNLGLNYQIVQGEDTAVVGQGIRRVGQHILNVHAQNVQRQPDGSFRRADLRTGDVDYRQLVAALGEVGFEGYLEIEFVRRGTQQEGLSAPEKESALRADYEFLREILTP